MKIVVQANGEIKGKPQEVTLLSPCPTDEWVPQPPLTILLTNCMIWENGQHKSHQ